MSYTTYQSIDLPEYPNMVGTIGFTVYNFTSGIITARQTTDITEYVDANGNHSGSYIALITHPNASGDFVIWDTGGNPPSASASFPLVVGGGGFSGPYNVTFQFNDASGSPVPYVEFGVFGVGVATTGENGAVTVGMNSGSYTVTAVPINGVMWQSTSLTVSGDTTLVVTGMSVPTPAAPGDPTLCTPYTYIWPKVAGVAGILSIVTNPLNVQGLWVYETLAPVNSDSTGTIVFPSLPIGTAVTLSIPTKNVNNNKTYYLQGSTFLMG